MSAFAPGTLTLTCLLLIAGIPPTLCRADVLDTYVDQLGKQVAGVCEADGYQSVRIRFHEPKSTRADGANIPIGTAPQLLSTLLAECLKDKYRIAVRKIGGDVRLEGEIILDEFGENGSSGKITGVAIDVNVSFVGRDGKAILNVRAPRVSIEDSETISRLLGIPFDEHHRNDSGNSSSSQNLTHDPIVDGLHHPQQPEAPDGIIRAKQNGAFGIQILKRGHVDSKGRLTGALPAKTTREDGYAIVLLARGDEFSVKLVNDADFEVGVQLTLDGVDSFHFRKRKGYWLIPPRSHILVNGWQVDSGYAKRFTVFPYEKSVAAELGYMDSVGVIQAMFHRTWKPGEPVPAGETGAARSVDGIGAGKDIASNVRTVNRHVGRIRASIPVRYERP